MYPNTTKKNHNICILNSLMHWWEYSGFNTCRTKSFLKSKSIRNEWLGCWSSKQRSPCLKRKPECPVCHWCHRQKTTLQNGYKAAGEFTTKHRGPYLFKLHTPYSYRQRALMVPTAFSPSGLGHIWLPCAAISISVHLASNGLGQLVRSMQSAKQASEGASRWGMWTGNRAVFTEKHIWDARIVIWL